MRYWKGLVIAAAFDVALIAGPQFLATEPPLPARSQAVLWPAGAPAEPQRPTLSELDAISRDLDSLMIHLQESTDDVEALKALARLYTRHGWWDDAIGPLARALALAPDDAELTKEIQVVVERSGRGTATAADLAQWAAEFVEVIEMWGHSC
ncbi:MAG TPA: tetratricopeptide repeat protein [Gemmatimonadales bacterium]|jgi:cytochrome c-type biogenesis protein CcmH/NrfG|nr:tetratricopeptide repeat protein [Gemmatimonadales bacterium]